MPQLQGAREGGAGATGPCWEAEGQVMAPQPPAAKSPRTAVFMMAVLIAPFTLLSSSQRAVTASVSSLDPGSLPLK